MRGVFTNGSGNIDDHFLFPNLTSQEDTQARIAFNPTGFQLESSNGEVNQNTHTYIYMAIRRGPLAAPESGTDVFDIDLANPGSSTITTSFPVDFSLTAKRSGSAGNFGVIDRMRGGKGLRTNNTNTEQNVTVILDSMDSFFNGAFGSGDHVFYTWKRAPNYFDVVAYDGDATSAGQSRTISHNLGVAPEMIWIKCRDFAENWAVYHSGIGATKYLNLNNDNAAATSANWWRNTAPTDSVFTIGHQDDVNANGKTHIAYLFASLDGVSKVGSFSGDNTSNRVIDCSFTSGARFVLIKCTSHGGTQWFVFDSERGITTGNDPVLLINATNAEQTGLDLIEPHSSGFAVNYYATEDFNETGKDYIFYAIA